MNPDTGAIYATMREAVVAGEKPEDIVEITGSPQAVKRTVRAVQDGARRKAKRRAQRQARKRGR